MKNKTHACSLTAALLTFGSLAGGVNAAIFTLDSSVGVFSDGLNNGDAITQEGITFTFSNVVVANGSSFGAVEAPGILMSSSIGDPTATDVLSFSISFSERVKILTYDIGEREDVSSGSFFTLSGSNGMSGHNSIPTGDSTTAVQLNFDMGGLAFFEANQEYSFTHNLSSQNPVPEFYFSGLSVQRVPEPSGVTLLGVGTLGVIFMRRRS